MRSQNLMLNELKRETQGTADDVKEFSVREFKTVLVNTEKKHAREDKLERHSHENPSGSTSQFRKIIFKLYSIYMDKTCVFHYRFFPLFLVRVSVHSCIIAHQHASIYMPMLDHGRFACKYENVIILELKLTKYKN